MSHGLGVSCPAALGSGLHAVQLPVLSLTFTSGNSSTSHWLQPWPRQKLMDTWMGCNNKVSLGTGGKAMKSVDLIVSCYKTVLLTLLLAHLVVDAPFLKLFKAKRHGALGWPSAWSATLLMAGGLELDHIWGPFQPQAILWFYYKSTTRLKHTHDFKVGKINRSTLQIGGITALLIFTTSNVFFSSYTLHLLNNRVCILQLKVIHKGSTRAPASGHATVIAYMHIHCREM